MFRNQKSFALNKTYSRNHKSSFTASLYNYLVTIGRTPRECDILTSNHPNSAQEHEKVNSVLTILDDYDPSYSPHFDIFTVIPTNTNLNLQRKIFHLEHFEKQDLFT